LGQIALKEVLHDAQLDRIRGGTAGMAMAIASGTSFMRDRRDTCTPDTLLQGNLRREAEWRSRAVLRRAGNAPNIKVGLSFMGISATQHHQLNLQISTTTVQLNSFITILSKMKIAFSIVFMVAAVKAQYNITSKPFQLVLTSEDGTINDTVSACHTGAALESLCLSNSNSTSKPDPTPYSTFNFNTSIYSQEPVNHTELGKPGILTWFLPVNGYGMVPSAANFYYDPTTDIAVPILETGSSGTQLAFDDQDELLVQGYIQWCANPPNYGETYGLKRWYACRTYYSGYQYVNLAWALGPNKPENPTCVKVDVKRVFV
jgi:hypothetical protein